MALAIEIVAERIKLLLERHKMTQQELSAKTGLNKDTLSKIVNAKRLIDPDDAKNVCKVFGVSLDYLYGASEMESAEQLAFELIKNHIKPSSDTYGVSSDPFSIGSVEISTGMDCYFKSIIEITAAKTLPEEMKKDWENHAVSKLVKTLSEDKPDDFVKYSMEKV